MNSEEKRYLKDFYNTLRDNIRRERSLKSKSVLVSFLESRSASRFKLLKNSTIHSSLIPNEILMSLLSKGYIQVLSNINTYVVTAKGVWENEQDLDIINEDKLLSYINTKYFTGKPPGSKFKNDLDDKEKTILLAMVSARAFSENSLADLKKSEMVKNKWKEILEKSYDLLYSQNQIKKSKESFFNKKGNEHVASSIFRHNNLMVQKTRGIYEYKGNYQYFLNLYENSEFSTEKLSYLFWKIFKGEIDSNSVDVIVEYCNDISNKESIYLFDMKEHIFSMPIYDSLLKDNLLDSLASKAKWAKIG
ncbi:hypothetical protein KAU88_02510 [Candidatus Bathyarchaeota archaeon]|nr:hypothetical protein [Candidatus Bathyarchaeota archaeon]